MKLGKIIYTIYDFSVPRFITEDVAVIEEADSYSIACPMQFVRDGEQFDGIATMQSFTWLGICWCAKIVGEVRPWEAWGASNIECLSCGYKSVVVHVTGNLKRECHKCKSLQVKVTDASE